MHHTRELHAHCPFQRAVYLGRNVVPLRRLADSLQLLNRFHLRDTGGRIDVVASQRDIELLSADQFSGSDLLRGIRFHGDHAVTDGELTHGHTKPRGSHLQQNARASAATRRIGQPSV